MANSDFSLTDMDMSVCMVDQGRVSLMHYYVKQETLPPYTHAGVSIILYMHYNLLYPFLFGLFVYYVLMTMPHRVYGALSHTQNSIITTGVLVFGRKKSLL